MIKLVTLVLSCFLILGSYAMAGCPSYFYAIKCDPKLEVIDLEIRRGDYCDKEPDFIKSRISCQVQRNDLSPRIFYLSSDGWGIADFRFLSGMTMRAKAGWHKIPRPFGENGAEQGYKLSVWVNKAKVLSSATAVKVVIDRKEIRFWENTKCKIERGWLDGECGSSREDIWQPVSKDTSSGVCIPFSNVESYFETQQKSLAGEKYDTDEKEYPVGSNGKINDHRVVILYSKNNPLCKSLVDKGKVQDFVRIPDKWQERTSLSDGPEFYLQDIDNDGKEEIVYVEAHFTRARYGSYLYVFKQRMHEKVLDLIKTLGVTSRLSMNDPQRDKKLEAIYQDLQKNAQHQYPLDWARNQRSIKSQVGKGVEFDLDYTFIQPFIHNKTSYALLYDDEPDTAKTFMVIKLEAANRYKEICVYKKTEPNF
jgi:hypothetical protein